MAVEYGNAKIVQQIAERLIGNFHPHLSGANIYYCFVNKIPSNDGRIIMAQVARLSGVACFLLTKKEGSQEPVFTIKVAKPYWDDFTPNQQIALIDHELCHLYYDEEKDSVNIRPHDIEEFSAIAERHGAWEHGLERFHVALQRGEQNQAASRKEIIERILNG